MSHGQHALRRKPIRLHLPAVRLSWRPIGAFLIDASEVLWLCVRFAFTTAVISLVIVLLATGVYESTGERYAAMFVVLWGFREIVGLLIWWAAQAVKK